MRPASFVAVLYESLKFAGTVITALLTSSFRNLDASSKGVLCKFFAHGACLKGEHCEFSHDWKDPPHNICTYCQKGLCACGSRCRYEHVKASRGHSSASSSSTNARQMHVKVPESVGPLIASTSILGMETAHLGAVAFIRSREC
uniref:C3H1-type domain-containing protein n=1 Tax=Quercus lobata TaxID=97700 RepID=A0A7N2LCZ9_QUELO